MGDGTKALAEGDGEMVAATLSPNRERKMQNGVKCYVLGKKPVVWHKKPAEAGDMKAKPSSLRRPVAMSSITRGGRQGKQLYQERVVGSGLRPRS
jgi:hypothetical protein